MTPQPDDPRYPPDALDSLADLRDAITTHARRIAAAPDLSLDDLERLTKIYSALSKVEVDKRKINTSLELARIKRDEAQAKLDAIKAKNNPGAAYGADAEAPWGRKFDGTPTTREEFLTRLDQSCADIYGLDLKYGPDPVIHRFPGDHLPEHMRTPENIALGQQGILPPGHPCGPPLEESAELDESDNLLDQSRLSDQSPRPDQSPDRQGGVTLPSECDMDDIGTHRASSGHCASPPD